MKLRANRQQLPIFHLNEIYNKRSAIEPYSIFDLPLHIARLDLAFTMSTEEEALQEQYEKAVAAERRRLCRAVRFPLFLLSFWTLIAWLTYEGDTTLAYLLLAGFVVFLLYLITAICCILMGPTASSDCCGDEEEGCELTEQQEQESTLMRSSNDGADKVLKFSFEDTPRHIRKCQEFADPKCVPKNGTYKVVYTLIAFGKQIRTEGHLQVHFLPKQKDALTNFGWEITGTCVFGKTPAAKISDGFVNAQGQLYWAVPIPSVNGEKRTKQKRGSNRLKDVTVYRGILDLEAGAWVDGEFEALLQTSAVPKGGRHEGRITRFEYVSEDPVIPPSDSSWSRGFDKDELNQSSAIPMEIEIV